MFEFTYTLDGKLQRIHARSETEVLVMIPKATNIVCGPKINNAKLIDTPKKGKTVNPGRDSQV